MSEQTDAELGAAIRRLEEWRATGVTHWWIIQSPIVSDDVVNWLASLHWYDPRDRGDTVRGVRCDGDTIPAAIDAALKQWEERE